MINRRTFLSQSLGGLAVSLAPIPVWSASASALRSGYRADIAILGGGLGGVAAALAALSNGLDVILTEETEWLGGQISQQGVPPDEHQWIETHGAPARYRTYRNAIRDFYRRNYPLTSVARSATHLNPGNGAVSRLCCEPKVAWLVLTEILAPHLSSGRLTLLLQHKPTAADVKGDKVVSVAVRDQRTGTVRQLEAPYFVDATELGDLLPLTGTEFVTGAEAKSETGELHAAEQADALNQQAFTMCFAMDYVPGEDHVIDKPKDYDFWRTHVPPLDPPWSGPLLDLNYSNPKTLEPKALGFHPLGIPTGDQLNLWVYRRIIDRANFAVGTYPGDITIVNWPQNDYMLGPLIGVSEEEQAAHIEASKQLSLSLFYWLQTEVPRPDGGEGWKGLRLRGDVMGTTDGMAIYPYVRESRRIQAMFTIKEEHVGKENRRLMSGKDRAASFEDSVGIGYYHIDLHPSSSGDNYIDFASLPFEIPLGALLPRRMTNLLPANKNIGTTHVTNGCYRLHPVEWSIGEAVGLLVVRALHQRKKPLDIWSDDNALKDLQRFIQSQGIDIRWPAM